MTLAILDARDTEYVVVAAGADLIATYVQQAILAGQTAQEVLDAILAAGLAEGVFPSLAAGEAGTTDGQYFWVGDGGTVTLYLNNTGTGDEIAELATMAALATLPTYAALAADAGAALIGIGGGQTQADKNAQTVSVFDPGFIPKAEQAAILAGTSTYDCTADIHAARDEVDGTGKILLFPGGDYYVGEVVWSGSNYIIETGFSAFHQKPGLTTDGDDVQHPIFTFPQAANNIAMGNARFYGNIASDFNEYSPAIAILSGDNISIGNVYGEDIRGDVIYQYGRNTSAAEFSRGVTIGVVSGNNIFRCIVAQAGGEASIAGILQLGPVGFQDYDAEPNDSSASYQPVEANIGFIIGSTVSAISADAALFNKSVHITRAELDGNRRVNSTPPYSNHNDAAVTLSRTDAMSFGSLRIINYPNYPINLADNWKALTIGSLQHDYCETVGSAYKSIIVQQNLSGHGVLSIGNVSGVYTDTDRRLIFNLHSTPLRIAIGGGTNAGGMFAAGITGTVSNLSHDCDAGEGNVFLSASVNVQFVNLQVTDSATTYGLYDCDQISFVNSTANFGSGLDLSGLSTNITAINSSLNGSSAAGVNVLAGGAYRVNGTKVIGAQGAAVADATDAASVITQLNALLARVRAHGLIAT